MDAAKKVTFVERGPACRVAVHDRPIGIDEKDRGAETVEYVSKCCRFRLAEIDHLAGANRTPHVRHDETHAATHLIIDHAACFVAHDAEIRTARRGFFQHGICRIDPALWLRPFTIKAAGSKLVIGNEIRDTDNLLDFTFGETGNGIESPIGLGVEPYKVRIDS